MNIMKHSQSIKNQQKDSKSPTLPLLHASTLETQDDDIANLNKWRLTLAIICVCAAVIDWVAQSELLQVIQSTTFNKPYFLSFATDAGYTLSIFFWFFVQWCQKYKSTLNSDPLSDLEKSSMMSDVESSVQLQPMQNINPSRSTFKFFKSLIVPAFVTNVLSMVSCYIWYISLQYTKASVNNTIYQSQVAFVYIGSVLLLNTKFTMKRNIGVLFAIGGVALIAFDTKTENDSNGNRNSNSSDSDGNNLSKIEQLFGIGMAFIAAIMQSMYELSVKYYGNKYFDCKNLISDSLFYQFMVGWITIVTMWPFFILLDELGIETFELPHNRDEWISVLLPMSLDLVFAALFYSGISLTNALFMSMASLFVIPMTYLADFLFRHDSNFGSMTIIGTLLIVFGFVFVEIPLCRKG